MKFYIASSLKNIEQVRILAELLKDAGWTHTYDWTRCSSDKEMDTDALRLMGEKEYNGIKQADIVIVLTPQGKGTHTEYGMAIALDKKVYLCHPDDTYFKCDENTSVFYWLSQVNRITGDVYYIGSELLRLP